MGQFLHRQHHACVTACLRHAFVPRPSHRRHIDGPRSKRFPSASVHVRCAMERNTRAAEVGDGERNVGTLWLLRRGESTARCSLVAAPETLHVRVMLDGSLLRSEECESYQQAFDLAKRWLTRMTDRGWSRSSGAVPR